MICLDASPGAGVEVVGVPISAGLSTRASCIMEQRLTAQYEVPLDASSIISNGASTNVRPLTPVRIFPDGTVSVTDAFPALFRNRNVVPSGTVVAAGSAMLALGDVMLNQHPFCAGLTE